MKNLKSILASAAILVLLPFISTVAANPADTGMAPKQRVEREFRQLETVINRYVQNEVLKAPDLDQMTRKMHYFMLEHPGVARMLRVNAGGHSVCDVSAGSPVSAPSRNISAQKWFQHISQTKRPYYSMDAGSASGAISLFYAWPLLTGPENNVLSGAFAALIDFTAHAALIENAQPFQIVFNDKPFFQHDWDEFDYIEEPLQVRGTSGMTIRTAKPIPTRLDPIAQSGQAKQKVNAEESANTDNDTLPASDDKPEDNADKQRALFNIISKVAIGLLALVVLLLLYSTIAGHIEKKKRRLAIDEPLPPPRPTESIVIANLGGKLEEMEDVAAPDKPVQQPEMPAYNASIPKISIEQPGGWPVDYTPMPAMPVQQQPAPVQKPAPAPAPQQPKPAAPVQQPMPDQLEWVNGDVVSGGGADDDNQRRGSRRDTDKEQMVLIANMLKLIREDFIIMDKKIQLLSQRISALEDFMTKQ